MNHQPLILTCNCGYRTPEVGYRSGRPLDSATARSAFHRHKCDTPPSNSTRMITVPCVQCRKPRTIQERTAHRSKRCMSCARLGQSPKTASEVDEIAVVRLVSGSPVRSTLTERQQAVQQLSEQGLTVQQIADRIGVSWRMVQRLRARAAA